MLECLQYASMGIGQFDIMYKERDTSCTIDCAFLQVQPMFISSLSLEECKEKLFKVAPFHAHMSNVQSLYNEHTFVYYYSGMQIIMWACAILLHEPTIV